MPYINMKAIKRLLIFLIFLMAVAGAAWFYAERHPDMIAGWKEAYEDMGLADTVMQLIGGEPGEVREKRKAEIVQSDPGHIEYYFSTLDDDEKRCYREILDGVREREEKFYITLAEDEKVNHVYKAVLFDHPELYWIHNREHTYRTIYGDSDYCIFTPGYTYSEEEASAIESSMENAWQDVLTLTSGEMSEYDKVQAVYTYVIENTDYVSTPHDQNIAGVFWQKEAVCAGYAEAVQYLLEKLGIYCIYVEGNSEESEEGHAWNIVSINGEYYYVDATNGDQPEFLAGDAASLEEHKTIIYDYLCPFPEEYESTYEADRDFMIPDCYSTACNFYVLNNACFDTYNPQEIYDLCRLRIDNNAAVIRFKFSNEDAFASAEAEWVEGDAASEVAQYYMQSHAMQRVEYHSGVLDTFRTLYFIF